MTQHQEPKAEGKCHHPCAHKLETECTMICFGMDNPEPTKADKLANPNKTIEEIMKPFNEMLSHIEACLGVSERRNLGEAFLEAKEQGRREGVEECISLTKNWIDCDCGVKCTCEKSEAIIEMRSLLTDNPTEE